MIGGEKERRVVEGEGLVQKYTSCELRVVFEGIVSGLLERIEGTG